MSADITRASLKTRGQQDLIAAIEEGLKSGTGPFADIFGKFNEQEFQEGVANPAIHNFKNEILPSITEKFIGRGTTGGSGMRRGLLKAGTDFEAQLAQLLYQARQQQKQNRISGVQNATGQNHFENIVQPEEESIWSSILPALGTVGGAVAGGLVAGPAGAATGAAIGGSATTAANKAYSTGHSSGSDIASKAVRG